MRPEVFPHARSQQPARYPHRLLLRLSPRSERVAVPATNAAFAALAAREELAGCNLVENRSHLVRLQRADHGIY